MRPGATVGEAELTDAAATQVARYKLPKAYRFVEEVVRSPSGKADYRWARRIVGEDQPASPADDEGTT